MIRIPEHIQELKSYRPGKPIDQIVEELNLEQVAVLWNNENNLGASPKAVERLNNTANLLHKYPDPASLELRGLIAARTGKEIENIVIGNGSESLLNNLYNAFCESGDELLTSEGTFVAVYIWAKSNNVPCIQVPLTKDYGFDLDAILEKVNEKTKIIYLANPNNPTGARIPAQELGEFIAKVPQHILVVVDEAYFEYAVGLDNSFLDSTKLDLPNIITLRTFSKAYGIAGVRVGYAIGPTHIIEPLSKVKMTFAPSVLAQEAGAGAIEDDEFLERTVSGNNEGIKQFQEHFTSWGLNFVPSFANFVMVDFGTAERVKKVFDELMQRGVFVRPLTAFGLPHCIRITIGTPEDNKHFLTQMKAIL